MDREHELSAVLADETRYHIYRAIAEHPARTSRSPTSPRRFGLHQRRPHAPRQARAGGLSGHRLPSHERWRPARQAVPAERAGHHVRLPPASLRAALAPRARGAGRRRFTRRRPARLPRGRSGRGPACARGETRPPASAPLRPSSWGASPRSRGCCRRSPGGTTRSRSSSTTAPSASSPEADPDLVCAMHRAFLEGVLEVVTAGLGRLRIDPGDCRISCGGQRCELLCTFSPDGAGEPAADG